MRDQNTINYIQKVIKFTILLSALVFVWGCSKEGSWDLLKTQAASSSSSISVTISSSASPVALVNPIPATITFSKEISGFELSDITVGNGTAGNLTETTANKVYTIDITPIRSGSQLTVDIPANAVADLSTAAVRNTAAAQFTIGYRYNALMDNFNSNVICKFDTTASGSNVSGNVSSFPVLIRITDAAIIDAVNPGAPDIRFFDTDASTLNYEIEEWDQDNDTASVWVMVPQVDGNSNSDYIMMFYDDKDSTAVAGAQNRNLVYDSNYVGVWHLNEDPSSGANSMENSRSASFYGSPEGTLAGSDSVSGMMGRGLNFSGDDGVNLGDVDITKDLTISAWVKASAVVTWGRIVAKAWATNGDPWVIYNLGFQSGGKPLSHLTTGSTDTYYTASALSPGTWYYVTTTYDGSNIRIFTNGSQSAIGAKTGNLNSNNVNTYIGMNNHNGSQNFQGIIDEVRISNTARSADWIKLSYENQKASQSLVTFE